MRFPKGFIIAAEFYYEGKLKLKNISRKTKVNSPYFQQKTFL